MLLLKKLQSLKWLLLAPKITSRSDLQKSLKICRIRNSKTRINPNNIATLPEHRTATHPNLSQFRKFNLPAITKWTMCNSNDNFDLVARQMCVVWVCVFLFAKKGNTLPENCSCCWCSACSFVKLHFNWINTEEEHCAHPKSDKAPAPTERQLRIISRRDLIYILELRRCKPVWMYLN